MQGDQEDHGAFVLLLNFEEVSDELPVAVDVDSKLPLRHKEDLVAGVLVEESISETQVLALTEQKQIILSGSSQHLVLLDSRDQPHLQILSVGLGLHLHLLLLQRPLEDVEVFSVEDVHRVLLGNDEHLALLHVLAESDSLSELEGVALDPLALGRTLIILVLLDLLKSHKEEAVVE